MTLREHPQSPVASREQLERLAGSIPSVRAIVTFPEHRTTQRVWGEEVLIAETAEYTGKLLYRYGAYPFHRGGLQWHPDRNEDAYLVSGEAWFYWVDGETVRKRYLTPGMSVHIPRGVAHSFQTVGDSLVYETSTPGKEPAVRVEDQYDISTAVES